ncbi:response regulator [Pseudomonas sp. GZD-209]|uniref:response regulator n=1 Tax=Pseudomonas sp. GZD-209 TaxID=3404807 RepID=UPI003BB4C72E
MVEEQTVTRHALRLLLEAAGHEVVAEADNGVEALQLVRQLQPALMIIGLNLPRLSGLELLQRLQARGDAVKVLVFTAQRSEYFAARCLEAGAHGFVSKHEDMAELTRALDAVLHGHGYFPSHVLGTTHATQGDAHVLALKALSARELAVLQGVCKGLSNVAIGAQLALSDKTVSTYKIRLKQKLQATSQLELIDIARRHGLVENHGELSAESNDEDGDTQRLLRKMIEALPYAVSVRDNDARLLTCNAAYLAQRNVTLDAIQGRRVDETGELRDEDPQLVQAWLLQQIRAGVAFSRDIVMTVAGQPHVLRHWGQPYHDRAGKQLGMILGNMDITDRDEQLRLLRQDAEQMRSDLHERDELLAYVTAELDGPMRRLVAQVPSADSERMLSLLQHLQQTSELNSGRYHRVAAPVDMRELLGMVVDQVRGSCVGIDLDIQGARHPQVWVDTQAVKQVIASMLGRAMPGPIAVRLIANGRGQGLVEVQCEVTADVRVAQAPEGFELVLARKLVNQMAGELSIHSHNGITTQTVKLMLTQA